MSRVRGATAFYSYTRESPGNVEMGWYIVGCLEKFVSNYAYVMNWLTVTLKLLPRETIGRFRSGQGLGGGEQTSFVTHGVEKLLAP